MFSSREKWDAQGNEHLNYDLLGGDVVYSKFGAVPKKTSRNITQSAQKFKAYLPFL
jgi:hypothetical protein